MLFRNGADICVSSGVKNETILHCILAQSNSGILDELPLQSHPTLLNEVISYFTDKKEGLEACLDFLLRSSDEKVTQSVRKIVNRKDNLRNTALHHASRLWPGKILN
jgi:hypothetical protein